MSAKNKTNFYNIVFLLILFSFFFISCGGVYLVNIEHPRKERLEVEKYKKILVAGLYEEGENQKLNIAEETLQYLRTELKKNTPFEIIDKEPIKIGAEQSIKLKDDKEFWQKMAKDNESDLLIWGKVGFSSKDDSGFQKMKVRSPQTGALVDVTRYVERTRFDLNLELYFNDGKDGEVVYQDKFTTSLLFRDKKSPTLPIFFSLLNRILPDFLGIIIPQPSTDSRYILP
jgi:hypothetical protein